MKGCRYTLRIFTALLAPLLVLIAAAAAAQAQKKGPAKPVDLNTASVDELQEVPGIGPTTAKAIVRFREKSGPFERVEDLLVIRGVSKARLEKMRPYLTVSLPAAYAAHAH